MKLNKNDWGDILVDVLALQEFAKKFWGEEVVVADDFDNDLLEWEYNLARLIVSKKPLEEIRKYYAGQIHIKTGRRINKRTRKDK